MNNVQLATLPGGFNAWVNLFRDTASRHRSLGVTRTVAEQPATPAASNFLFASATPTKETGSAPAPSVGQSSSSEAVVIEDDMASSDDGIMSEANTNLDGPSKSVTRTVADQTKAPAASPISVASPPSISGAELAPAPGVTQSSPSRVTVVEGDMASSDDESMSETDSNLDGSTTSLDHAAIRARALAMLGLPSPVSAADDDAENGLATKSDDEDDDESSDSSESTVSSVASAIDHDGVKARAEKILLQLSSGLEPPSATFVNGDSRGDSAKQTSRQHTAPAPPMWRFQTIAKKSEGYSSAAAGSYIAGKSSSELAAKYVAPSDEPAVPLHDKADAGKEIGRITTSIPKTEAFVKTDREVGKLNLASQEGEEDAMKGRESSRRMALKGQGNSPSGDLPAGSFNGSLSRPENSSPGSRQPFREFNNQYEVAETKARDIEQHSTGNIQDNWSWEGGYSPERQVESQVDRLNFKGKDENDEGFIGAISKSDLEEVAILSDGSDEYSERDGYLFGATASTDYEPSDSQMDVEIGQEVVSKSPLDVRPRKRQRCLYLLLLLLLLAVAILGVLLGTNREDGAAGARAITVVFVPNATNSSQPSTAPSFVSSKIPFSNLSDAPSYSPEEMPSVSPSLLPTRECPVGTKVVTIDYVELIDSNVPPSSATNFASQQYSLTVKNACYGNEVARCLPCPVKGVAPPAGGLDESARTRFRRVNEKVFEDDDYSSTTICLPDMQEYYLEVAPVPSYSVVSPCCGLTSNLAPRVTYDGVIVAEGVREAYFGTKEGGCQSQLPSVAPTERPSASPSGYPSSPPSSSPTSSAPTQSPLAFAGPCPEEFAPLSYYPVGTRISRGGVIYECLRVSCGSYGFDPGSSVSSLWRQSWAIVGSCAGTFKPTIAPSRSPTDNPTKTVR